MMLYVVIFIASLSPPFSCLLPPFLASSQHKAICCHFTQKPSVICDIIQVYSGSHGRTMVFAGTKAEANELALNAVLKQECQVRLYVYRRCTQDSHALHP